MFPHGPGRGLRLSVIINGNDGGGGDDNGDKSPKSRGREDFTRGGGRRDERCVCGSVVVGGEAQWRRGPHQRSGATRRKKGNLPQIVRKCNE